MDSSLLHNIHVTMIRIGGATMINSEDTILKLQEDVQYLKTQLHLRDTIISKLQFRVSELEDFIKGMSHKYNMVSRDSPIYKSTCDEDIQDIQNHFKMTHAEPSMEEPIKGNKFIRGYQKMKNMFRMNRQKNSYKNKELERSLGLDPKTMKKSKLKLMNSYPDCFEYVQIDKKNWGIFLKNRTLFEKLLFRW